MRVGDCLDLYSLEDILYGTDCGLYTGMDWKYVPEEDTLFVIMADKDFDTDRHEYIWEAIFQTKNKQTALDVLKILDENNEYCRIFRVNVVDISDDNIPDYFYRPYMMSNDDYVVFIKGHEGYIHCRTKKDLWNEICGTTISGISVVKNCNKEQYDLVPLSDEDVLSLIAFLQEEYEHYSPRYITYEPASNT